MKYLISNTQLYKSKNNNQNGFVSWLMIGLIPVMMTMVALGTDVAKMYSTGNQLSQALRYASQVGLTYYGSPNFQTAVANALQSQGANVISATTGYWCIAAAGQTPSGEFSSSPCSTTSTPGFTSGQLPAVLIKASKANNPIFSVLIPTVLNQEVIGTGGSANIASIGADTCPIAVSSKLYFGSSENGSTDHAWDTINSQPKDNTVYNIGYQKSDPNGWTSSTGWDTSWKNNINWTNDNNNTNTTNYPRPTANDTAVAVVGVSNGSPDQLKTHTSNSVRSDYLIKYANGLPYCVSPAGSVTSRQYCQHWDEPVNTHYQDYVRIRLASGGGTTNCVVPIIDSSNNNKMIGWNFLNIQGACSGNAEYQNGNWVAYTDDTHTTRDYSCNYGSNSQQLSMYYRAKLGWRDSSGNFQHQYPANFIGSNQGTHANYGVESSYSMAEQPKH